ncbi:Hypothetical protein CINCED_3A006796 [Cinara cedri]|uniref:Uncharacterized protein n=1 Tax=Cinara cedri TaxID=506608 RepID=A0A5E4MJ37_9HEMI|nr:Hypothetical protein CINCED_3A006796 [Cinara cedri]
MKLEYGKIVERTISHIIRVLTMPDPDKFAEKEEIETKIKEKKEDEIVAVSTRLRSNVRISKYLDDYMK